MEDFTEFYIEGINIDELTHDELKLCIKEMMVRADKDVDFRLSHFIYIKSGFRNTRGA